MRVSIIMPFHNAAPWLAETIASIQQQSHTDWELIAIDDFSADDSKNLIKQLCKTDPRIKIFSNTEKGIIPALQLGSTQAKGTYLTRMDADDLMPEDRLKKMVDLLKVLPEKSIVTGKVQYFSDDTVSQGYRTYEQWLNMRIDREDHFKQIYRECVVASPNWMGRRLDIESDRIFEKLSYPEDYDMTFQWMQLGYSIHTIKEITLLWREHPQRTSRNSDVYDQVSFFELKLKWFQQLNSPVQRIGIMGAGRKGKLTARILTDNATEFNWYDLNFENYLSGLDGNIIKDYRAVDDDLLLIAIYPNDLEPLKTFLTSKGYEIGRNAWFL